MTHVLLDMNGTLLDPSALAEPLGGTEEDEALIDRALAGTITAAMAETLAADEDEEQPAFTDLLEASLRRELAVVGRVGEVEAVIDAASRMAPFPEAEEAIVALREAGFGIGVLTNSPTEAARELIAASGLELDPVIGCDRIGTFKPDPEVYEFAAAELDLPAGEIWLVAAHWWDVMGAKRAGLRAGWVSRGEHTRMDLGPTPDVEGADLLEVAAAIADDARRAE